MSQQLQGTMILCPGLESASEVLRGIDPATPDLFIGRMADDRRLYNALCVCPDKLDFPAALRTLVLADVPVPENLPENVHVYRLREIDSGIWEGLPDVDQMREVYKAALRLDKRPLRIKNADELDHILAEESGQTMLAVRASLLALQDMQLIAVREKPFALILLPKKKTNPDNSIVWQRILKLRNQRRGEE